MVIGDFNCRIRKLCNDVALANLVAGRRCPAEFAGCSGEGSFATMGHEDDWSEYVVLDRPKENCRHDGTNGSRQEHRARSS